jgi:hypothetical protein
VTRVIFNQLITNRVAIRWQQCLEKASEEFNRAIDFLENVNKQHEAAKELDILNKVIKTEKIKAYFTALNQIYTVISRVLRTIAKDTNKYNTMASPMAASLPFLVDQTGHKWKSLHEKAKALGLDQVRTCLVLIKPCESNPKSFSDCGPW